MCHAATILAPLALLGAGWLQAQSLPEWRHVGGFSYERRLPSPAGGPVERAWFSPDGARLLVRTGLGQIFQTADFENWQPVAAAEPPPTGAVQAVERFPSTQARLLSFGARVYALGDHVYLSEDGGKSWANLTAHGGESVIGAPPQSLAVSPRNPDDLVVGNEFGVWRSLDGGLSWAGLNERLPNLPAVRILSTPVSGVPARLLTAEGGAIEFLPGTDEGWVLTAAAATDADAPLRESLSATLKAPIASVGRSGDHLYAGASDGRIWASLDGGVTWPLFRQGNGRPVSRIFAAREGSIALAAAGGTILRTTNGGAFWDDITGNLEAAEVFAVTADRASGAIYAATPGGVFTARVDLQNATVPAMVSWTRLRGLPAAPVRDLALDTQGNQLFVAVEGFGLYAAAAPHRRLGLRVVNAADLTPRAAAPGSLLSVLGARVQSAQAGALRFPVLAAADDASQLQVPFETTGPEVALAIDAASGQTTVPLPVRSASPAIFVSIDGAPMVLDGDSGLMLDAGNVARSNSRIQILATGLGMVSPSWPTGLAAPLKDPPAVAATVEVLLDRAPLQTLKATLAPGYVGFYVVEAQLPAIVNAGPAELYLSVDGQESNRVRIYLEP